MALQTLTFGIELEILVIRPPSFKELVGAELYDSMLALGIPTAGHENIDADWEPETAPYTRWRVGSDYLRLSNQEAGFVPNEWQAEAIELSSRKFNSYYDNWRAEVHAVLQALRHLEARGCRFITNKSTGFHVHVGNGDQKIPLRTAKNVFQLVTAHEKSLDLLHSISRIAMPDPPIYHHYYYPVSFFHRFAADPEGANENAFDWLANIEEGVQDYRDLGDFFNHPQPSLGLEWDMSGHNSTCNFDNLFPSEENARYEEQLTGTIEFRQHEGSVDWIEIVSWVVLTCNIVEFCSKVRDEDLLLLCLRVADKDFGLEDFLAAIDANGQVMDHYLNHAPTIGVLHVNSNGNSNQCEIPIPPSGLFNAFIEQNDHEHEYNSNPDVVKDVVGIKYACGLYGLNPEIEMCVQSDAVSADLKQAMVTVHMRGVDPRSEEGMSRARAQVFRDFARVYEKGTGSGRLPLMSVVVK